MSIRDILSDIEEFRGNPLHNARMNDLEVAVREHLVALERAVGLLRTNLRTEHWTLTGVGGVTTGHVDKTVVEIHDVAALEGLL